MAEKKERIETLRKEKLKDNFSSSGISTKFIEDFTIRLSKEVSEYRTFELAEVIKKSIKKQIEKHLVNITDLATLEEFIQGLSFGSNKITIKSIEYSMDDIESQEYVIRLLAACSKDKSITDYSFESNKHLLPLQVEVKQIDFSKREYIDTLAYSLGKKKFGKRYHNSSWYMKAYKNKRNSLRVLDLATICSEVFLMNTVEQFSIKNKELYVYRKAEELYMLSERLYEQNKKIRVPQESTSRLVLIDSLKKYNFISEDTAFVDDESLNQFGQDTIIEVDEDSNSIHNFSRPLYEVMLKEFVIQANYIKEKVDRAIKESSDYARSFQTKKHINKKTKEIMANNKFLSRYGYVELDNDVSLEKFNELEKEFVSLTKKVYVPKCADHSFRIKKLGKHRAAGLYYTEPIRATIFDLDYPDAYCHELGHQIDHVFNKGSMLSETIRFKRIVEKYKTEVNKQIEVLPSDDQFLISWNGKSKFNSSYYFQPTEVFARSFELYLYNKGIETSFLKKEYSSPVYPTDKDYLKLVEQYFDELFQFFEFIETTSDNVKTSSKKEEDKTKVKVAESINNNELVEEAKNFVQLTLF